MATAIRTLRNFVDGEHVDPAEGRSEPILNPATGEQIASAPLSDATDVDRAVRAARRAFDGWANATPAERSTALLKIADAVEQHGDELAELEALDAGKPIEAVKADEIPVIADNLRFFAGAARQLEGLSAGEYMADRTSMIRREPIGVVGQIAPWNYPLMMAGWKIGPALAAGNTVVLKPAETTPTSTWRWRRSPAPATTTPGRTAPPRRACWPARGCTTTSCPGLPHRRRASCSATRSRLTRRWVR